MVLHLLGKKSWNVYNHTNVDRVRRDEAEAQAREEAEEQRMQEADAANRTATLRGVKLDAPSLPYSAAEAVSQNDGRRNRDADRSLYAGKRRRLRGEDDTDRDIRYAREDATAGEKARKTLAKPGNENDAPLLDHVGHLQLIPAPDEASIRKAEKNAEAEAEKERKRKREDDQYTMRFSNAAGFKSDTEKPWYASDKPTKSDEHVGTSLMLSDVQQKDVWGNDDVLRKGREGRRISSNDPFATMLQAQRQLKQNEREKEKWQRERMAEVEEVNRSQERKRRHERKQRRGADDEGGLEGFSLVEPLDAIRERSNHDKDRKHRHHHRQQRQSQSSEKADTRRRRSSTE